MLTRFFLKRQRSHATLVRASERFLEGTGSGRATAGDLNWGAGSKRRKDGSGIVANVFASRAPELV